MTSFLKMFSKLFTIYLFSFLLFSIIIVRSNEYNDDYESSDKELEEISSNKSLKSTNSSDDYDYNEETSDECQNENFIEKIQQIHREGRNTTITKNVHHINETFGLLKNLTTVMSRLFGVTQRDKSMFLEFLSEIDFRISSKCTESLIRIIRAVSNTELWAIKMLDSMGSFPPSGFAEGVLSDFGEYDECLGVSSPVTTTKDTQIKGQYCLMKIILPYPRKHFNNSDEMFDQQLNEEIVLDPKYKAHDVNLERLTLKTIVETLNIVDGTLFRMGICMPNTCTSDEIEDIVNKLFQPITKLPVELDRASCVVKDEPVPMDYFEKIAIIILILLITLVIVSTFAEIIKNNSATEIPQTKNDLKETTKQKLLYSFSIIRNTETLFSNTNEKWQSLDTLRLLLIIYVYIAHVYIAATTLGLVTLKSLFTIVIPRMFRDQRYWFSRNPLMIDALYTISGFLISYGILRKLDRSKGRFNYFQFVFQQWIRFTVLSFGSLLFFYVFRFTGEGPLWHYAVDYNSGCKDPWNLFRIATFLNNFYEFRFETFHEACNLPLWFLSALMQFLIISPPFIIFYWHRPVMGKYLMIAALVITNLIAIVPYFVLGVKPYLQILIHGAKLLSSNANDSINWYHTYPNVQIHSYFVGIAAGIIMKKGIYMSRNQVKICWIGSVFGIVLVYVWQASFWTSAPKEPVVGALLWHTLGKFIFSTSFSWIVFGLCSERGYYLNRILSWSGFRPLARLSFGIYLLHFLIVGHRIFDIKYTHAASDRLMWRYITLDLIWNVIIAYIYYILIESPFANVFKVLFPQKTFAPIDPKEKPESNNNSSQSKDMNHYINGGALTVTVNGNVNNISELSKL